MKVVCVEELASVDDELELVRIYRKPAGVGTVTTTALVTCIVDSTIACLKSVTLTMCVTYEVDVVVNVFPVTVVATVEFAQASTIAVRFLICSVIVLSSLVVYAIVTGAATYVFVDVCGGISDREAVPMNVWHSKDVPVDLEPMTATTKQKKGNQKSDMAKRNNQDVEASEMILATYRI